MWVSRMAAFTYRTTMSSVGLFLLWLVSIPLLVHSQTNPRGYLLNCGAGPTSDTVTVGGLKYTTDEGFISVGNTTTIKQGDLVPILSTLRYFPDKSARKYCYSIPVTKGGKYLVRTTYYYGGFDGGKEPPVFDQIVEGTKWSVVNTTEDYANGMSAYYEIVILAKGKTLSVCLARNSKTGADSSPFISALELEYMDDSVYNATNFNNYALTTVARNSFGNNDGDIISFPDDKFNRLWHPFKDQNPVVTCKSNVTPSDFWNAPPAKIFGHSVTASRGKQLQIQWPPVPLPTASYYIALYFQDNRSQSPFSWRVFNVSVNGKTFYANVNVSSRGLTIYGPQWPLSGQTQIVLIPEQSAPVGPVISAGEILQVLPLGPVTVPRDVHSMHELKRNFDNPPPDWSGDPCLPEENSWTGVTCVRGKKVWRVSSLNLTGIGLSGSLAPNVGNLTALHHIWLGKNKLSGTIPELGSLKELQTLHLENNQFEGRLPQSLGKLQKLREIFLQNNKLEGNVPVTLQDKKINIQLKNELIGSASPVNM